MTNISIAFMTLGCKVNYYETSKLKAQFESAGALIVPFNEKADIYVVNTCTVTNIADRKSRKMLHRAKRINEDALVVAMGCFAEANKDNDDSFENIDLMIGNDRKEDAYTIIMEKYCADHDTDMPYQTVDSSDNAMYDSEVNDRTRAYVKIQDGCNQFCSYCKIPYVRGKLKSREPGEITKEVNALAEAGYKEVVITGIHLSSYGVDKSVCKSFVELKGKPLLELADMIASVPGIERIRFGSLEPRIITDEFVTGLVGNTKVCPHFHLSLQSGCDRTLAAMNRKYTTKEYEKACELVRKYYDRPAITTDIIVGFPGETEEDFEETLSYVERIAFSNLHVFKYSPRKGTKAAEYGNQIAESIKHNRSSKLIEDGEKMTAEYICSFIGEEQVCLVEEKVKVGEEEYYIGHNERYIKLMIPASEGDKKYINEFARVVPERCVEGNMLLCRKKSLDLK